MMGESIRLIICLFMVKKKRLPSGRLCQAAAYMIIYLVIGLGSVFGNYELLFHFVEVPVDGIAACLVGDEVAIAVIGHVAFELQLSGTFVILPLLVGTNLPGVAGGHVEGVLNSR